MKKLLILLALVMFSGASVKGGDRSEAAEALHQLFDDEREYALKTNPLSALFQGKLEHVDGLPDVSPKKQQADIAAASGFLARLREIDRDALGENDQLNHDLFDFMLERRITAAQLKQWRIPFTSDSGFHTFMPRLWRSINFRQQADYELYLKLLNDMPRYFDQQKANLRMGLEVGYTMPKVVLDGLLPTFGSYNDVAAADSPFFMPFKQLPDHLGDDVKADLKARAEAAIRDQVLPAFAELDAFMKDTYYPSAKDDLGASSWPDGTAHYDTLVKYYTSLDITADEVHKIGLAEVARIRAEMDEVIKETGFEGSFDDFVEFLRTDPQFYAKSADELVMRASYIAKLADAKMPSMFRRMPRQPYGVEPVPEAIAPNYTTGRYVGAAIGGTRAGTYWVNTYALDKRPLYVLPALTLHEGVPGHHHQIALAKELENVPDFRKSLSVTAFSEGWGLYTEKMGIDMGIYRTPYEHFGRLSYEMWRACRLVVDTGMHAKGWTRDQAIACLEENSALSKHNIRTEVDRYISWPGQALGYKMGEISIVNLRRKAEEALGGNFDIRAFHDHLIGAGAIPLSVMEARMNAWIEAQLRKD